MAPVTVDELLRRNKEYANSAKPIFLLSNPPAGFQLPKTVIFCCVDLRIKPEEFLQLGQYEAFVIRNVGGNIQPYLNDILFLDKLLNFKMEDIIVIHHQDCGTSAFTADAVRDDLNAHLPGRPAEIDGLTFHMHNGNVLEESVRSDLAFLKSCSLIRPELKERCKGFVFNFETNRLEPVDA